MYGVEDMEILGKRLKWLRNKNRFTQKEVSKMVGMTPSGLQKIENDERDPKLDVLIRLCDIYGVSADFLLGRNNVVGDLEEIGFDVHLARIRIETEKRYISETDLKIMQTIDEINNLKKNLKNESSMSLQARESLLQSLEGNKAKSLSDLHQLNKEHSSLLLKYIASLLDIPNIDLNEDGVLKKYLPIGAEIQPDIFESYSLHLYGKDIGFIGHYGEYSSIEKATEDREKLLLLLNGK